MADEKDSKTNPPDEDDYDDEEYDDEDDEPVFYDDVELSWEKYTTFDNIHPDNASTLFIALGDYDGAQNEFSILSEKLNKKNFESKVEKNKYDYECLKVISNNNDIAIIFALENCLAIRFLNSDYKLQLREFFENEYVEDIEFFGEIDHIEEQFTIKKSKIRVFARTGIVKDDSFWEPESFWKFYLRDTCIGQALIQFHASEMCDCAPTILMFEVFPDFRHEGLGSKMIYGIERYMWERGFSKVRLDNTKAIPFWRKLDYDIDIDEGEKYLDYLDFEKE